MKRLPALLATTLLAAPAVGCLSDDASFEGEDVKAEDGKYDASANGVFLDAECEGRLVVDSSWNDRQTIDGHLLYLVGQLNGHNAGIRYDNAVVTDIRKTTVGGRTQITYKAKVPVLWPKRAGAVSAAIAEM